MSKWKKKLYNPVYVKETKLRVRNIKFALTILFYNLILIGIAVFGFEVLFNSGMNDYVNYGTAIGLYVALVVLESVMVGFLVPSFTAGSIAGEREKQTLEILLTTTMKPSEIVWGKLMASISMVLLLVVSSLRRCFPWWCLDYIFFAITKYLRLPLMRALPRRPASMCRSITC